MRSEVFQILEEILPTFSIGQHQGNCENPYVVLKFSNRVQSNDNFRGSWQYFEAMIYIPRSSMSPMEGYIKQVIDALKDDYEPTGKITPDYFDEDVQAYMRSVEFRLPNTI